MPMRNDDELLAAYADGIAELSSDERRRVEALLDGSATMRDELAATRGTIDQLRALPPVGEEPDWNALERSIRGAVADMPLKRPFWSWGRSWKWLVPTFGTAVAALAIVVTMKSGKDIDHPVAIAPIPSPVAPRHVDPPMPKPENIISVGGEAIDIGDLDIKALDDPEEARDTVDGALLAQPDLGWMEQLDDRKLDRIEKVLQEGT